MPAVKYGNVLGSPSGTIDYGSIADPSISTIDYGSVADVFPALPGLKWSVKRTPIWKTITHESASGKEVRVGLWTYPRWQWSLSFEFLRSCDLYSEFQDLTAFYNAHRGALIPFLYPDPEDYTVSDQLIGYGDGQRISWQMVRTLSLLYATSTEPVKDVRVPATIHLDGVVQTDGWSIDSNGVLTFVEPPLVGSLISADFSYWWRVRFVDDRAEYENFMLKFWQLNQIDLISVK